MKPGKGWRGMQDKQLNNISWVHWFIDSNTSAMLLIVYKCNSPTMAQIVDMKSCFLNFSVKNTHIMVQINTYKACASQALNNKLCAFLRDLEGNQSICCNLVLFVTLSPPSLRRSLLSSPLLELQSAWLHQTGFDWCGSDPTLQRSCAASFQH